MARRRIWFGSIGPYLYDDTTHPGGIFCEGRIKCGEGPIDDDDVVRKQDIEDLLDDLKEDILDEVEDVLDEAKKDILDEVEDLLIVETQSVEVVTEVDFENEEVTTETVTYVSDVYLDLE